MSRGKITAIIPAYNEEASIADSVRSLQAQTRPPDEIVVVDDCSSDRTGERAAACGVKVLRPPRNTGAKAGAQNFALQFVDTEYTLAIDADTILAPDALEKILPAVQEDGVAAACGSVIPRYIRSVWERGRYVEYLLAFSFCKQIQDYYHRPMIASGCFSIYRTDLLKAEEGWPVVTRAEDMDLTWRFYERGYGIRFVADAVSYPIEPHTFKYMRTQLKRWSHGFMQNLKVHQRSVLHISFLRLAVAVALWDAVFASLSQLLLAPLLAFSLRQPILLLAYVADAPVLLLPILYQAIPRRQALFALSCLPAYFMLRFVNAAFVLEAMWSEFITGKELLVFEKGH